MVDAVVFDFGGVLWDMRWDVARDLDRVYGLPNSSVFETLYRSATWRDIERGIGDAAAWRETAHRALEQVAGRPLPPLHEEWRKAQAPIEPNLALVRSLQHAYKLSILSNADCTLRHRLEHELAIHELFDDIVCSAEVGMAKPDAQVFRLAAERLGVPAERCVFVDDWDKNVEAARAVGMHAVLYRYDKGHDLQALLATAGVVIPAR